MEASPLQAVDRLRFVNFRKQRLALAKQQPKAAPGAAGATAAAGTAGAGATAGAAGATATAAGAPAGAAVPVIDPPKTPEELDALAAELVKAHQVGMPRMQRGV